MKELLFSREGKTLKADFYLIDNVKEETYPVTLNEFKEKVLTPFDVERYGFYKSLKNMIEVLVEGKSKIFEIKEISGSKGSTMPCASFLMISTYCHTIFIQMRTGTMRDYKIIFKDEETGEEVFTISGGDSCNVFVG